MTDFGFIVGMVTIYQFLHRLHGPTIKLQGRSMDIVQAYQQMDDLKKDYKNMRNNVDKDFKVVYTLVIELNKHWGWAIITNFYSDWTRGKTL